MATPDTPGDPALDKTIQAGAPDPLTASDLPQVEGLVFERELARGGMGVVYRGRQEYLSRTVAIKLLSVAGFETDPEASTAAGFASRFRREAELLASLGHPHIVTCHTAGVTDDGRCYLVMAFVDGPTLRGHVEENGPLPASVVTRLARQLTSALAYAHKHGIIHRDVKPENVLLQADPNAAPNDPFPFIPQLADLGLAKIVSGDQAQAGDPALTAPGTVLGSPATMAPEQFDAPENVDHRTDIYGLGCVLFHALTAAPAFREQTMVELVASKRHALGPDPRTVDRARRAIPDELAAVVRQMLARDPARRPADYDELRAALERVTRSTDGSTDTPSSGHESRVDRAPSVRRSRGAVATIAVVILAVATTAVVWTQFVGPTWSGDRSADRSGDPSNETSRASTAPTSEGRSTTAEGSPAPVRRPPAGSSIAPWDPLSSLADEGGPWRPTIGDGYWARNTETGHVSCISTQLTRRALPLGTADFSYEFRLEPARGNAPTYGTTAVRLVAGDRSIVLACTRRGTSSDAPWTARVGSGQRTASGWLDTWSSDPIEVAPHPVRVTVRRSGATASLLTRSSPDAPPDEQLTTTLDAELATLELELGVEGGRGLFRGPDE